MLTKMEEACFLRETKKETFAKIGKELGISRQRAHQLYLQAQKDRCCGC